MQTCQDGHLGWCEALLTSILQSNGLNFITISPSEALQKDLVFPSSILVTKLPIDLTPEELAPPLPWLQMNFLDVCVTNENFLKITENYNITGKSNILLILSYYFLRHHKSFLFYLIFHDTTNHDVSSAIIK